MKLLVLTSVYPQEDDGKYNVTPTVKYFSEKWVEQGHEVIVIHSNSCFPQAFYLIPDKMRMKLSSKMGFNFPTKESRYSLAIKKENLSIYRLPLVKVKPHGKFGKRAIANQINKIVDILKNNCFEPELIVGHWVNPQIELLLPLGERYNAKTSLVFHDDCSPKKIVAFDLINKANKLGAIGCRSNSYAEYVQKALQLPKKPFICHSGVPDNLALECANGIEDREFSDKPEYIYVGRLVKFKHVDTIIGALHQVYDNEPFKFHIVGSGAEREHLEAMVKEYGMEDRVAFHGQVAREEAFSLMQQSTCFVMVSEHETFGMVYIEAMLAGCITIAAKGGGVDGVIVDGENGFLSEEGNEEALVNKFRSIKRMDFNAMNLLRKKAISTAVMYSDGNVAKEYLDSVIKY